MPRKPREDVEGAIQHVFARGNNKHPLYRDESDRWLYLHLMRLAVARARWLCLSYCLMDNHAHFLIETPAATLSSGMQWFHGRYARRFNDRHKRSGHVFQGRFGSNRVTDDVQMWITTRYIARNPVEAGCCREASDWPWSSHALTVRGRAPEWVDRERLLSYFGALGRDPAALYQAFVDAELQ